MLYGHEVKERERSVPKNIVEEGEVKSGWKIVLDLG